MKNWLSLSLLVLVAFHQRLPTSFADRYIDFLSLDSPSTLERSENAHSEPFSTNGPFPFGQGQIHNVTVSSNGFISMGVRISTNTPVIPGTDYIVSPYGADTDTSISGTVTYTQFSSNDPQLSLLNEFIKEETGFEFDGNRMMIVEWYDVAKAHGTAAETSTFQAVLITNGTESYAVFIYECDKLGWDGAVIGWAETGYYQYESDYRSGDSSSRVGCQFQPKTGFIYRLRVCEYICTSGECIPYSSRCDGYNDCVDESDEEYCYDTYYCSFYCDSGDCGDRCDGYRDCYDNSDEENCDTVNVGLAIGLSVTIFCILFFLGTPICVGCAIYYRARRRLRNRIIARTGGRVQETSFMTPHPHISPTPYPTQPCAVNAATELGSDDNRPPAYDTLSPSEDQPNSETSPATTAESNSVYTPLLQSQEEPVTNSSHNQTQTQDSV